MAKFSGKKPATVINEYGNNMVKSTERLFKSLIEPGTSVRCKTSHLILNEWQRRKSEEPVKFWRRALSPMYPKRSDTRRPSMSEK